MTKELEIIDDSQGPQIPLVARNIPEIPLYINYDKKSFDTRELIMTIGRLFYNKGASIPIDNIVAEYGLERAGQFSYYIIKKIKNDSIGHDLKYGKHHFYPKAVILITKKGEILDTTIYFNKGNLPKLSEIINVNICSPNILLKELLNIFIPEDSAKIVTMLVHIAKSQQSVMSQDTLINYISDKLLTTKEFTNDTFEERSLLLKDVKITSNHEGRHHWYCKEESGFLGEITTFRYLTSIEILRHKNNLDIICPKGGSIICTNCGLVLYRNEIKPWIYDKK